MAETLRELGHEVTILTTSASGNLDSDHPWVVRTQDLQTSAALRRVLRRPMPATDAPCNGRRPSSGELPEPSRIFTRGLVPDSWVVTWLPYLVRAARRVIPERGIEALVTNGPPDSTHLLGLALGRSRPAWIADFRDGWRYEPLMGRWPTRIQDRADAALESRVVHSADAVVAITAPIAKDLAERYGRPVCDIPSGWDPAKLDAEVASAGAPQLQDDVVNIVHTGSLSLAERRDPRGLFTALEDLVASEPAVAAKLRLTLAGALTNRDRRLLDALPDAVRDMVQEVGLLPKPAALALQRAADVLLLLSTGPHRQVVTAKLSEYLLAQRPILGVLSENEAARIIRETRTGIVVAPKDVAALRDALRGCVDGRLADSFTPQGLDRYIQPAPAKQFAAVIEGAIAAHSGADQR
jgi:glycosyltransferase involved in cell wall biosynthesis